MWQFILVTLVVITVNIVGAVLQNRAKREAARKAAEQRGPAGRAPEARPIEGRPDQPSAAKQRSVPQGGVAPASQTTKVMRDLGRDTGPLRSVPAPHDARHRQDGPRFGSAPISAEELARQRRLQTIEQLRRRQAAGGAPVAPPAPTIRREQPVTPSTTVGGRGPSAATPRSDAAVQEASEIAFARPESREREEDHGFSRSAKPLPGQWGARPSRGGPEGGERLTDGVHRIMRDRALLRRAIVAQEILAPPVALRPNREI